MSKVINVKNKEQLIKYAAKLIQKSELSEIVDKVPFGASKTHHDEYVRKYEAFCDAAKNVKHPREQHVVDTMLSLSEQCLTDFTRANGEYIAEMVAYHLIGNEIDGVTFNVPENVRNELLDSIAERSRESSDLNRRMDVYTSALDSMLFGREYDYNEIEMSYAGYTPEYNGDHDFESAAQVHREVLRVAAGAMGDGYEEYAHPQKFAEFSGERAFSNATLRIDMHACEGLSKENYAQRLSAPAPADAQWATDTVNNMLRNLYGNAEYEHFASENVNMFDSIYIDGVPASVKYVNVSEYSGKCAAMMKDILDGGHRIDARRMEEVDGKFMLSDEVVPVDVLPSLVAEEKFSLWRAILRFFGIDVKTNTQKFEESVSFSELENWETVDRIERFDLSNESFKESVSPVTEARAEYERAMNNIDRYAFGVNFADPNAYFKNASRYYHENGSGELSNEKIVDTLFRQATRCSLVVTYMMSKDMTLEQIMNPTENDKQLMKKYGKEFADIVTFPTPEQIAKQMHPDYNKRQIERCVREDKAVRARYEKAVETKSDVLSEMYARLKLTLEEYETKLPAVDYTDINSIASALPSHSFYVSACCDLMQSVQGSMLRKDGDPMIVEAYEYGSNGQFNSLVRDYAKNIADPGLGMQLVDNSTFMSIGILLSTKNYLLGLAEGEKLTDIGYIGAVQYAPALSNELERAARGKDGLDIVTYAKDIISGKKPFPENLIDADGKTHLQECYLRDKAPEASRQLEGSKALR